MGELFMHLWQRVSNLRSTALAAAVLVACASPQTSAGRIHVVDDAGDTVRLAEPARRVVSLIPATTELLFAIGAGPNLVGRTAWCDYPPAAAQVPNLGDGNAHLTPVGETVSRPAHVSSRFKAHHNSAR